MSLLGVNRSKFRFLENLPRCVFVGITVMLPLEVFIIEPYFYENGK